VVNKAALRRLRPGFAPLIAARTLPPGFCGIS
jgi:hypothetical protein